MTCHAVSKLIRNPRNERSDRVAPAYIRKALADTSPPPLSDLAALRLLIPAINIVAV
jgi:hypothetical protein